MDKINKLSLPVTILIASVILGGFYYASEVYKQPVITNAPVDIPSRFIPDSTTTLPKPVGPETYSGNVAQSGGFLSNTVSKLAWIGGGWANSNSEYLNPADNYLKNSFYEGYGQSNMMSVSCKNGYEIISYSSASGNKLTISPTNTAVSTVIKDQPYNNIFITCAKQ